MSKFQIGFIKRLTLLCLLVYLAVVTASAAAVVLTDKPRLQRVIKTPGETVRTMTIDYAATMQTDEVIDLVSIDDTGTGVVTEAGHSGTTVALILAGGDNGERIPVTITATGDAGSVRQALLLVEIVDPMDRVAPVTLTPTTLNWEG